MSFTFGNQAAQKPVSFSFGTTSAAPATSFAFGAAPTATAPSFGFGAPAPATSTPSSFGFGSVPATTSSSFGFGAAPATTAPGFGFGTMPAASASSGFGFGAAPPTSTTSGFGFGTTPATTASAFGFGSTPAAATASGFGFGATPATTASAFGFGSTPATTASSFGFGTTPATTTSSSFGLNAAAPATAPPGFGVGSAPATSSTNFGFGASASTAAPTLGLTTMPATSAAPTFGFGAAPSSLPSSLGFGTAPTTATPVLGAVAATTSVPSFGFKSGVTATTPSSIFSGFGAQVSSSTATGLGSLGGVHTTPTASLGGFGAPAQAGSTFGLAVSSSSTTAANAPSFSGLGGNSALTSTTSSSTTLGLGGTASLPGTFGGSHHALSENKTDSKAVKETPIPAELQQSVEDFKKYIKEEKSISSDIAHISAKIHEKISSEVEGLMQLVTALSSGVKKNKMLLEKLKNDASQELLNAEIAQRTKDTPAGLQYENTAPYDYFARLITDFENQMLRYRQQIEETEQHLQTMTSNTAMSPNDLMTAIQKLHLAFTSLVGRYQPINESLKQQKRQFCQQYRHRYGTNPDMFPHDNAVAKGSVKVPTTVGPSPFPGQMDLYAQNKYSVATRSVPNNQQMPGVGPPTLSLGALQPGASSLFPANNTSMFYGSGNNPASTPGNISWNPNQTGVLSSTPGLFGSTTLGNTVSNQSASLFQTSGKRGKH